MKKAIFSLGLFVLFSVFFGYQIFAAPGDPLPPQSMTPTPSSTPTITPTTTVGPTIWVANLDSGLDVRNNAPNDGINLYPDVRIEVGDPDGANANYQYVSVLSSFESVILSKFYSNFSGGANLDWSKFVNDFDKSRGAIYFNSADDQGISSIPGIYDNPKIFLKNTATHNINRLGDNTKKEDLWGNTVSVDNLNNIAVIVDRFVEPNYYETWVYIWNDPAQFSKSNADHIVNIGVNYPTPTYSNAYGTVESIGDGLFLVAWFTENNTDSTNVLHYKVINAEGNVVVNDTDLINGRFLYLPSRDSLKISKVNGDQVLIVWKDGFTNGDVTRSNSGIGQIIGLDGSLVGDWFYINPPEHNVSDPDVDALSDGRYVIVYYEGNNEDLYYRIYDPSTQTFAGDPVFVDDYNVNDFAGYLQNVAADDKGGFGIVWGGYYDDGVDYFDRVYFQIFDENQTPLYSTDADLLVSDDVLTLWYWDSLGIEFFNNEYQIVWDTWVSDGDYTSGIAYRKITIDGVKSNTTLLEKSKKFARLYPPAMDINRDGVPVIIWKQATLYTDQIYRGIFGMFGPVPSGNAYRIGFCPNVSAVNEVNKDCTGLTYMSPGDPGISWSTDDDLNNLAHESYVLSGFDKGGAFVDGLPAFAFRDFGQGQSTYDNLEIKWYDTGLSGDGTISFYYDTDNSGFDGTAISGTYLESGAANSAILDLSSLPAGNYYLYAVVDDGYYTPFRKYSPQTITKTEIITPTPTIPVTITDTPIVTLSPTTVTTTTPTSSPTSSIPEPTDENIPSKVKILQIGLISNIIEKDFVGYYFTSQSPVIKGIAEAFNTVHFTYSGKDYTTTADSNGSFTITINDPILPRTTVDLIYYSENGSGVQSATRVLRLIIGVENFPDWLIEDLNKGQSGSNQEVTISTTMTSVPSVSPSKSSERPSGFSNEVEVLLKDLAGQILINSDILFDAEPMKTDENGKIFFDKLVLGEHKIEYKGEIKSISVVKGQNSFVVYYLNSITEDSKPNVSTIYYILIFIAIVTTSIIAYKIYKKR